MTSHPLARRRRLLRVGVGALAVAVLATACGLSDTARSSIKAGSGSAIGSTAGQQVAGGAGQAAQDAGAGAATDPNAAAAGGDTTSGGTAPDPNAAPGAVTGGGSAAVPGAAPAVVSGGGGTSSGTVPGAPAAGGTPAKAGSTTAKASTKATATTKATTKAPAKTAAPVKAGGPVAAAPAPATSAACSTAGGDATGITATDINIGLHAPLTGTGTPFPNSSFVEGSKIFWKNPAHKVCGRNVNIDFEDDTYTPDGANKVCRAFATTKFLVLGGAGTDQIQACATNSDMTRNGVPYISAGVTENGLTGLANYFAASLTYRQQGNMLVTAAKQNGYATPAPSTDGSQWAIVTADTGNFTDARDGITQALDAAGIKYTVFKESQNGDYTATAAQLGQQLALRNYKTVYTLAAPGFWVKMIGGFYTQSPTGGGVTWTGPGVSFSDFLVAQLVCSGSKNMISGHAFYLAPNTGLDRATSEFKADASADGQAGDDIQWGLYGLDQSVYAALTETAKTGLTRQNFIASLQRQSLTVNGSYAPIAFNGHFGGTGAYVQKVDCGPTEPGQNQPGTWTTVGTDYLKLQ